MRRIDSKIMPMRLRVRFIAFAFPDAADCIKAEQHLSFIYNKFNIERRECQCGFQEDSHAARLFSKT